MLTFTRTVVKTQHREKWIARKERDRWRERDREEKIGKWSDREFKRVREKENERKREEKTSERER